MLCKNFISFCNTSTTVILFIFLQILKTLKQPLKYGLILFWFHFFTFTILLLLLVVITLKWIGIPPVGRPGNAFGMELTQTLFFFLITLNWLKFLVDYVLNWINWTENHTKVRIHIAIETKLWLSAFFTVQIHHDDGTKKKPWLTQTSGPHAHNHVIKLN